MRLPPGIRRLFRLEIHTPSVARAVDDELRFHFDMTVRHLMSSGMSEHDARREAERRFGDVERTRANLEAIDRGRDERTRRVERWHALVQDLRYTLRGLRARPAFSTVIVLTLALGIGANATMFGIVDRLLLRPPAFLVAPHEVHRVYLTRTVNGIEEAVSHMSYKRYLELSQWTTTFADAAAFANFEFAVGTGEATAVKRVGMVSASFFHFFDVRPVFGRFFGRNEDRTPEGAPVAVLSYGAWQSDFGGRRDILGKPISIGRRTYSIIGVAPEGFVGTSPTGVVAFVPITLAVYDLFAGGRQDRTGWYTTHNLRWMQMLVRRKPGISIEAATADLTNAYRRGYLAQTGPGVVPIDKARPRAIAASVIAERGPNQGKDSQVATWLVGVAVVVLLIACANVANLLLARAFARRREVAIRIALGVSRSRLVAQLLAESLVLALVGGAAGLVIAQWGGGVLRNAMLPNVEWANALADPRLLVFTAIATLAVGLLTGLAPAVQVRRRDIAGALKAGAREGTYHRSRLRTVLLVTQGSLSVVLLVGAGLFVRSLRNVRALDLGFDADRLLHVEIEMRGVEIDSVRGIALRDELMARARAIPGVANAALTVTVPFYMSWNTDLFDQARDSIRGTNYFNTASPRYFETMGTRILRGRGFEAGDRAGAPKVLVVSQSVSRRVWPGQDALGRCIRVGADTAPCSTVVGVVEDIVQGNLIEQQPLEVYGPNAQLSPGGGGLFVRTQGDAGHLAETVRRELQRAMPGISYVTVKPMQYYLDPSVRSWQLGATMFALFGGLALLLAAVGLYSVIAYNVTQRSHELGVRIALGAQAHDVLGLVLGSGVRVTFAGILIGGAIAFAAGRFVAPLLYRVSPRDPLVFAIVVCTLLAVAIAASLLPARRASKVDPNVVLRAD